MSSSSTRSKPKPPKDYDGAVDAWSFHHFVTEGTDYVVLGKVAHHCHVFMLSYHLKGKAYDFYTQQVTMNVYAWMLEDFFVEMFNYCFPIDYSLTGRNKENDYEKLFRITKLYLNIVTK